MACAVNEVITDFGCIPNDPVGFVQKFYGIGLSIIGMVALLFLIIGGYFILTSQGSPDKLQKGKEYILYSILGVLLAVFGFVVVQVITGVLAIPGFS
jgi:glucose uptake protein GlcU